MAPRGGRGGGGRGGGSTSTCPDAFLTTQSQVNFANDVVFFAVFLGIALALCTFRKKSGPGKKLIGVPFMLAVFFFVLYFACSIIATVLQQCEVTDFYSYYNWAIALSIFYLIASWLILFVVVYQLNAMLRKQLGHFTGVFKIIYLVIVAIMGALTIGFMAVSCYNIWTQTLAGEDAGAVLLYDAQVRLNVAYQVLYMVSVLGAGVLALITIMSLRSRRDPAGDLIGWVVALYLVTVIWSMLNLVPAVQSMSDDYVSPVTNTVLYWIGNFFQALTFIFLMCIAKHQGWGKSAVTDSNMLPDPHAPTTQQQQYGQPSGQAYYYQQGAGRDAPELVK